MHDLLFIIYAALAMVLLLISSFPHFRSRNVGAASLVTWGFLGSLGYFMNAIVWWDNVEDHAPVWCDIWTRIAIGLTTGVSAGCLCINRRLKIISSAKRVTHSTRERRNDFWTDVAICFVPPVFVMCMYYTVQGNRYNIGTGYGCQQALYVDWRSILAIYIPPLLMGCVSFVYGGLAIYNFTSRRRQFQSVLQKSGGGLNTSRFIRLVSLSSVEMLLSVPLSAWGVAYVVSSGLHKPLSWTDTHAAFSTVYTFGDSVALASARVSELSSLQRWVPVFASFAYFCFFGMQEESILTYWSAISWVGRVAGKPFRKGSRIDASTNDTFLRLPQLGNTITALSPSSNSFPNRSVEDLEKGGLSLTMTEVEEKEDSLGLGQKKLGIAVRVERNVEEE